MLNKNIMKYPFSAVPDGWIANRKLIISPWLALYMGRVVQRNSGDSEGYHRVPLRNLRHIWITASKIWIGRSQYRPFKLSVLQKSIYGYYKYSYSVCINRQRIDIGCQTIHRYELEQLAMLMGWPFPRGIR